MTTLSYLVDFEIEIEIDIDIDIVGITFQSTSIPIRCLRTCTIRTHQISSSLEPRSCRQEHRAADARGLGP